MSAPLRKRPIAIDLFAGVGGLSLGFEQAGFDVVAAVEIDPIHAAGHKLNFPDCAVICRDVRTLSGAEIREAAGTGNQTIDVLFGGPPCQGFSLIGHRVLEDPRNSLVFHFLRLVGELKPRAFVMENVPGMATGRHTELLAELADQFQRLGYKVRQPHRILNAANFGVPQDRRRLFLIGARADTFLPEYPEAVTLPPSNRSRAMCNGSLALDLPLCPTAKDALIDLPDITDYDSLLDSDELRFKLAKGARYAMILRGAIEAPNDYSYLREWDSSVLTGMLRAEHTAKSIKRFDATGPGTTEPVSRFFRVPLNGICNTLRAGTATDRGAFSAPRPIHPIYPRCISVREAARLHSYPDWFRFHRTIWHGFRQIGNSVPPHLGRAVAASIMAALGEKPKKPKMRIILGDSKLATFNMREAAAYFGVDPGVIPPRKRVASLAS
ncbi:MAG TPA: DNA cytosine methyltransferase [Candidatus Dormibacteraeota bacterium]|nr:DNA cytosine methyltransferase [Candidatus Dormibacteraeota bacterium]